MIWYPRNVDGDRSGRSCMYLSMHWERVRFGLFIGYPSYFAFKCVVGVGWVYMAKHTRNYPKSILGAFNRFLRVIIVRKGSDTMSDRERLVQIIAEHPEIAESLLNLVLSELDKRIDHRQETKPTE